MLQNLTGWHFVIILFIVLLLFGAPKLPALAKSLGQSMKILKAEVKPDAPDDTRDSRTDVQGGTPPRASTDVRPDAPQDSRRTPPDGTSASSDTTIPPRT